MNTSIYKTLKTLPAILIASIATTAAAAVERPNNDVKLLNVVGLLDAYMEEQVAELVRMSATNTADIHMISFHIVPEGDPLIDKISIFEKKYLKAKKIAADRGAADYCRFGILMNSIFGHAKPFHKSAFQYMESPEPWAKELARNFPCPLDKDFIKYVEACSERIGALRPDLMLVDDDFRVIGGRNACVCPLHVKAVNERFGLNLTQESLSKHLLGYTKEDRAVADKLDIISREAMENLAKTIRRAVDKTDPAIRIGLCNNPSDVHYLKNVPAILAGKGNKSLLRVGASRYQRDSNRDFGQFLQYVAYQQDWFNPDEICGELDTYPRNRYSISAQALHNQFAVEIMFGATYGKFWPTRTHTWEPKSAIPFKEMFRKNRGFYNELSRQVKKTVSHSGLTTVIPPLFKSAWNGRSRDTFDYGNWLATCGTVMGLPVQFSKAGNAPAFLTGHNIAKIDDENLRKILSKGAILDSTAAFALQDRGLLEKYAGISAKNTRNPNIRELRFTEDTLCVSLGIAKKGSDLPNGIITLEIKNPAVRTLASFNTNRFIYCNDAAPDSYISPAVTYFENSEGGRVAVFAAIPEGSKYNNGAGGFPFMNESVKALIFGIANDIAPFDFYYAEDAEILFFCGKQSDGDYLVFFSSLSHDTLENIPLKTPRKVAKAKALNSDGTWHDVKFSQDGNAATFAEAALPLNPVILKISVED